MSSPPIAGPNPPNGKAPTLPAPHILAAPWRDAHCSQRISMGDKVRLRGSVKGIFPQKRLVHGGIWWFLAYLYPVSIDHHQWEGNWSHRWGTVSLNKAALKGIVCRIAFSPPSGGKNLINTSIWTHTFTCHHPINAGFHCSLFLMSCSPPLILRPHLSFSRKLRTPEGMIGLFYTYIFDPSL